MPRISKARRDFLLGLAPEIQQQVLLHPDRKQTLRSILPCLAFVAAGVWIILDGQMAGWLVVLFFGTCAVVFSLDMLPGASYLHLTHKAFFVSSGFRSWPPVRWDEISEFHVVNVHWNNMVAFSFNSRTGRRISFLNRLRSAALELLPDTYGLKAPELAELLNRWRSFSLRSVSDAGWSE